MNKRYACPHCTSVNEVPPQFPIGSPAACVRCGGPVFVTESGLRKPTRDELQGLMAQGKVKPPQPHIHIVGGHGPLDSLLGILLVQMLMGGPPPPPKSIDEQIEEQERIHGKAVVEAKLRESDCGDAACPVHGRLHKKKTTGQNAWERN